ncbi:MAG: hypothetical protein Q7T89_12310 [Anaerolineales bacterium]|nr:hypothetical protein [Anaerolineales bacterium]
MSRQDAFAHLKKDAQEPVKIIPLAQEQKRDNRAWDRAHRGMSYRIPLPLHVQAKDIRASILGLAHQHMTSASSVAAALMSFSLAHVRQGKLAIEARPNANRRKMILTWAEADEWPQEIQPAKRAIKTSEADVVLTYRWGKDVGTQIKALAGAEISVGEVVVYLLSYALLTHKSGRLRLKEEAFVVSQKVSPSW